MGLRLFIEIDGEQVAAMSAHAVPRVGDDVWFRDVERVTATVTVLHVEHQLDRSNSVTYGTHDVKLTCKHKPTI